VNRELEAKARGLAGLKAYITNIDNPSPEFVIDAYHQLWRIEKSFRMSKHDLRARPIYAPASAASGCHARLSQSCTANDQSTRPLRHPAGLDRCTSVQRLPERARGTDRESIDAVEEGPLP